MRLDLMARFRIGRLRFDHVGIERSLDEIPNAVELVRFLFEDRDEFVTDADPLLLRLDDAGQAREESFRGVDLQDVEMEHVAERGDDSLGFVCPQEPRIDEDAGQLRTDRARNQSGRDRGIDAARERADHFAVSDLRANLPDRAIDERLHLPGRGDLRDAVEKIRDDALSRFRVDDFGVELDAVELARGIAHRGDGARNRAREYLETGRRSEDGIAVRHPSTCFRVDSLEERRFARNIERRRAEFAVLRTHDLAAEIAGHELHAVADAEERDARGQHPRVDAGGALRQRALRAAGENDRRGFAALDIAPRRVVRQYLGIDVCFAHAARDQLRILRAEIQNYDGRGPDARRRLTARRRRHRGCPSSAEPSKKGRTSGTGGSPCASSASWNFSSVYALPSLRL